MKYNFIFLSSKIKIKAIDAMFKKNNYEKFPYLIEIGYPKIDYLRKKYPEKLKMKKDSIIIAPTLFEGFPEFSILEYLKDIIIELLNNTSYNIILRPHPGNRNHIQVHELINHFKNNIRFKCDLSENYIDTYAKSQILITDISGTAYTYAFLTLCPVIFFLPNEDKLKKYNYDKLNFFQNRNNVGGVVNNVKFMSQEVNKIIPKIREYKESIEILIKEIKYFGKAKEKLRAELDLID